MVGSLITASSAASRGLLSSARASSFAAAACVSRSDLPRIRSSSAAACSSARSSASISAISASSSSRCSSSAALCSAVTRSCSSNSANMSRWRVSAAGAGSAAISSKTISSVIVLGSTPRAVIRWIAASICSGDAKSETTSPVSASTVVGSARAGNNSPCT